MTNFEFGARDLSAPKLLCTADQLSEAGLARPTNGAMGVVEDPAQTHDSLIATEPCPSEVARILQKEIGALVLPNMIEKPPQYSLPKRVLFGFGIAAAAAVTTMVNTFATVSTINAVDVAVSYAIEGTVPPELTPRGDCTGSKGVLVVVSSTGLDVAPYAGDLVAPLAKRRNLCPLALNNGTNIRVPAISDELARLAPGVVDTDKEITDVYFYGLSGGANLSQLIANDITERYPDTFRVVGKILEGVPSGPRAIKKPVGRFMVENCVPIGKAGILYSNIYGILYEQARRDENAVRDIYINTRDTSAQLLRDYECMMRDGFAEPVPGENSLNVIMGSRDTDDVVDIDVTLAELAPKLGDKLTYVDLPGAWHAGGWKSQMLALYDGGRKEALDRIDAYWGKVS